MILLYNVKITDKRIPVGDYRKCLWAKNHNRLDVFKFSLNSISYIKNIFEKIIINVIFEDGHEKRQNEFENYVLSLFNNENLFINYFRYNIRKNWNHFFETYNIKDDDVIFFMGNDDHVFMDSNLETIKSIETLLKNDQDPMCVFGYSHFPECIRLYNPENSKFHDHKFFSTRFLTTDFGISAFKGFRLKEALFKVEYDENHPVFRLDELHWPIRNGGHSNYFTSNLYMPIKELFRHFDGYGHATYANNLMPPLDIPNNFFNNDVKIKYGYRNRNEGYYNVNPSASLLFACNPNGLDSRYFISEDNNFADLPLFLQDKISKIEHSPNLNYEYLKQKRNEYYIKSTKCKVYYIHPNNPTIPESWLDYNILK